MIVIKTARRMLMNVNAGTTRGRRKSSQCSPNDGDDHYVVFLGENLDVERKEGVEYSGRLHFSQKMEAFLSYC